jgi:hypothetical protein
MRRVAAIDDAAVDRKTLECLDLLVRAPRTPAPDTSAGHESVPWDEDTVWAFDQTPPHDGTA